MKGKQCRLWSDLIASDLDLHGLVEYDNVYPIAQGE